MGSRTLDSPIQIFTLKSHPPSLLGKGPTSTSPNPTMLPSPPRSPPHFQRRRPYKPVPILRTSEESRNARRSLFLKKVQSAREDQIWKARGGEDEVMRMIFVAEQKRWEASLEKAASRIPTIYEEEEEEEVVGHEEEQQQQLLAQYSEVPAFVEFDDEFDEFLDRDGKELEELLSQMDLDVDQKMEGA